MIKLIVGSKGSGKTKAMIDMINNSVKTTNGNIIVVEKGMKLTFDIDHAARLIDLDEYKVNGGEMLYGFVAGHRKGRYHGQRGRGSPAPRCEEVSVRFFTRVTKQGEGAAKMLPLCRSEVLTSPYGCVILSRRPF